MQQTVNPPPAKYRVGEQVTFRGTTGGVHDGKIIEIQPVIHARTGEEVNRYLIDTGVPNVLYSVPEARVARLLENGGRRMSRRRRAKSRRTRRTFSR